MQHTLVFLGGSPSNTPALYNLMSHVDFNLGVYYPTGGMGAVSDGIAELGRSLGVDYQTNTTVRKIAGQRGAFSVRTADGRVIPAEIVVSNADYAHTERELLPAGNQQYDDGYWASRTYAPSAFLLYLGVEGTLDELAHHSLVLPDQWEEHFAEIFDQPAWPTDPAYYICVPSCTDPDVAPSGHAALFALVPIAPGLPDNEAQRDRYRDQLLADIAAHTGADLRDRIVVEERFSVSDFAQRYNSYRGTALGLAHTLSQTSLLRPRRQSTACDGLYYTGADTTPGIGVPMCLISGEHTAQAVAEGR